MKVAAFWNIVDEYWMRRGEAHDVLDNLKAEPRGLLRINAPMSFGTRHLGGAIADFMASNSEINVDLVLNDRQVDLIEEGFDMAIRIARLPDSSLIARRLAPCRRIVVASPEYWDKHGRPTHPEHLSDHSALLYDHLAEQHGWTFKGSQGTINVRVSGKLRTNNGDVLLAAARAGLGVDMVPTFICSDALASGELEAVLQDFEDDPISVYALYPHRRHLSTKVRAFVDFLAHRFSGCPYWDDSL